MKNKIKNFLTILIMVLTSLQLKANIRVQNLQTSQNTTFLTLENAELNDQPFSKQITVGRIFGYFDYSWVNDPWIDLDDNGKTRIGSNGQFGSGSLVKNAQVLNLGASYLLTKTFQIGFELPIEQITTENQGSSPVNVALDGGSTTGLGDSRLFANWNFINFSHASFSLIPTLYIPTGFDSVNNYYARASSCSSCDTMGVGASYGGFGGGLKLAADFAFDYITMAINAGFDYHPKAYFEGKDSSGNIYKKVDFETTVPVAIGFFVPIKKTFGVNLEFTSKDIVSKHNEYTHPGEALLGLRYWPTEQISVHAAIGSGNLEGLGGNDPRYIAGIKLPLYMPAVASVSEHIEKAPPVAALVVEAKMTPTVVMKDNKLELLQNIEFETGSSKLTAKGQQILDEVSEILKNQENNYKTVSVDGHTDHKGSAKLNQKLSTARALTAKNYLITKGIPAAKLKSQGFGSTRPKYDPKTATQSEINLNRRVEFTFTK